VTPCEEKNVEHLFLFTTANIKKFVWLPKTR